MSTEGMPEPMASRLGYVLKCAQVAVRRRLERGLRQIGITAPQYAVLAALELQPGISSAALARAAFVTPQTMQAIVAHLEKRGLLTRSAGAGRSLRSDLTPIGRRAVEQAHAVSGEVEDIMRECMTHEEWDRVSSVLMRCAASLTHG